MRLKYFKEYFKNYLTFYYSCLLVLHMRLVVYLNELYHISTAVILSLTLSLGNKSIMFCWKLQNLYFNWFGKTSFTYTITKDTNEVDMAQKLNFLKFSLYL